MLSTFDKINIAACASRRAQAQPWRESFQGDYETTVLWKNHKVHHIALKDGEIYKYVTHD